MGQRDRELDLRKDQIEKGFYTDNHRWDTGLANNSPGWLDYLGAGVGIADDLGGIFDWW